METREKIIGSRRETYRPAAILIYGSYADGSVTENSDFDALVIAGSEKKHDSSVIDGAILDVFIYPADTFRKEYDPQDNLRSYQAGFGNCPYRQKTCIR